MKPDDFAKQANAVIGLLGRYGLVIDRNEHLIQTEGRSKTSRLTWQGRDKSRLVFRATDRATLYHYVQQFEHRYYSAFLACGALLQFAYDFDEKGQIVRHRLALLPTPLQISWSRVHEIGMRAFFEEALGYSALLLEPSAEVPDEPEEGESSDPSATYDEGVDSFGDEQDEGGNDEPDEPDEIPWPLAASQIRVDYDIAAAAKDHPASHLTLNHPGCRIPVARPLTPRHFVRFLCSHELLGTGASRDQLLDELSLQKQDYLEHPQLTEPAGRLHVTWKRPM